MSVGDKVGELATGGWANLKRKWFFEPSEEESGREDETNASRAALSARSGVCTRGSLRSRTIILPVGSKPFPYSSDVIFTAKPETNGFE